jgi:type IV pilus assembly protein PilQ
MGKLRRVIAASLVLLGSTALAQHTDSISAEQGTASPKKINLQRIRQELPKGAKDTTSLSFKDADLRDVFRAISFQHGLNIFLDNSIVKRTSISLTRIQVFEAIEFLCEQNNLVMQLDGGIFKIVSPPEPAPQPPPPKIPLVGYENGFFSASLKDDDLEKTILEIQKKSGKNILIISGTTGVVTGKLMNIEFDQGFIQLMNNNGFAVQKKNSIYVVSRLDHYVGTQGTATQQKSGPYWIAVKDSLVTLDVTNAPLERILPDMIRQLNTDVVFYNQLSGNVTARATHVPLDRALDLLLRNTNYTYKAADGIYFVGEKANKALIAPRLLKLKYLRAETLVDIIPQSISSQGTIKVMKEHNGLMIIASNDVVAQLQEYLEQIDKPVPQVLIEALVVDYDISEGSEFGMQAGLGGGQDTVQYNRRGMLWPGIDMEFRGESVNRMLKSIGKVHLFGKEFDFAKLGRLPKDFYLNLKAMEQEGLANVKSRPLIATLNGYKATLSVGTTQYFLLKTTTPYRDQNQVVFQESQTFQSIQADVKLEITPYVGTDSLIILEIKPDFRTPIGQLSPDVPPTINTRSISSTVVVKEGETIVIGGLIQESENDVKTKVPILGSIPWIGGLFSSSTKSKRKAELIIYVTPHISYGHAFQQAYVPEDE